MTFFSASSQVSDPYMPQFFFTLIFLIILFSCSEVDIKGATPQTLLMDTEYLLERKRLLDEGDPQVIAAYKRLIENAESALHNEPYTVTDKERLAPSGDKHDYASYSRYWWPDSTKVDGLPYLRKDGETNPASQDASASDRPRIGDFAEDTETLGLAYYFSGEDKYAHKVAELLRVWFLDKETRMNPNLNHAQCRLGHNEGTKSGVLDGRLMIRALEASLLIADAKVMSDAEFDELKVWASQYFNWLTTSKLALDEAASNNNHACYYDAQAAYFALYADNPKGAEEVLGNFYDQRLMTQIRPDGAMPREIARTRPLFYSIYNLHAIFCVAQLAQHVNVDVFRVKDQNSRLRAALDYVAPYAAPDKVWPTPTVGKADKMDLFPILLMADRAYPNGNYNTLTKQLDAHKSQIHRAHLALPLMR
jgi:hypothetical protein